MSQPHAFLLIDKFAVNAAWNGSPTQLLVNQNIVMPQTPNGTLILAATNQTKGNCQGQLSITSGGVAPVFVDLQANANQPTIEINNWKANNLSLTNISLNNDTPILVQAVGPGIPGTTPQPLVIGTPLPLGFGQFAQGNASPQYMQLVLQSTGPTLGIIGFIGGPADNAGINGYVVTVNDSVNGNTGPGTGKPAPAGYYATTASNSYAYTFNWGSSAVFAANLSPLTAASVSVLLRAL
ncbi:MAG: hypothetical protein ACREC0_09040 [Methylocella sp.]